MAIDSLIKQNVDIYHENGNLSLWTSFLHSTYLALLEIASITFLKDVIPSNPSLDCALADCAGSVVAAHTLICRAHPASLKGQCF